MDIQPELPDRLARDLDGSFEDLVLVHQRLVFGLALRVVGDRADAEEGGQDTFGGASPALGGPPAEAGGGGLRGAGSLEGGGARPLAVPPRSAAEPAAVAERGQERELLAGLLA